MEYIGVTNSKSLVTLDSVSLSRFNRLVALDLSHNSITSITNTLGTHSLTYLLTVTHSLVLTHSPTHSLTVTHSLTSYPIIAIPGSL